MERGIMTGKTAIVEVLKGDNGTSLVINNRRVSPNKIYGFLTTMRKYEVLVDDILEAIGVEERKQGEWIPIVRREPTEEEKKDYFEQNGEELCYMIDSPMPENGQEVLVSGGGIVAEDVFDEDLWNFENWDIEDVEAWMPLPKAYEAR